MSGAGAGASDGPNGAGAGGSPGAGAGAGAGGPIIGHMHGHCIAQACSVRPVTSHVQRMLTAGESAEVWQRESSFCGEYLELRKDATGQAMQLTM